MAPFARKNSKRKRDDTNEDEEDFVKTIQGKLHHGLKEIKHAAKKAKAFEIRRIIKRLKQLKKQPAQSSEIQRAEAELELLKALDHDRLAHAALYTKLHKDHLVKNAHIFQASSSILTPPSHASPTKADSKRSSSVADVSIQMKLESRVLSSKTLATEVKTVLDHLRHIVEPLTPLSGKMNGTHDNVGDEDEEAEEDTEDENDGDSETSKRIPDARSDLRASESDEDSSVYDDDELKQGHGGLAQRSLEASQSDNEASNADDAGWESGSISPTSPPPKRLKLGHSATPGVTGGSTDEDKEDVQSNDASDSDEVLTSSRFLPSLNVGFTRGESDGSDWSGAEDDANAGDGKQRKNRRGQRARQAIWEKKYGKNANHIKHQREQEHALAEAQALAARAKRGGIVRGRGRGGAVGSGVPKHLDGGWKGGAENAKARMVTGGTPLPKGVPPRTGKGGKKETGTALGALHPSWEAKRKMKEKEKIAIVPAQGKKIKFS
ncbi:hypothetical protein BS47DRAFT_662974 [Hydnum rufescens UP504]|uniref:Bud22 domain-containing protein n=1 Tax=Hydnum rufescens UP504 TaxID=1448309 RepID=A0A9P6B509_9AGAM|nr:hypothetical protein BS47DRAFT_662974 [Hydnum rufescens UP504]